MDGTEQLLAKAGALRRAAERESDALIAVLCQTLSDAYERVAAERLRRRRRLN